MKFSFPYSMKDYYIWTLLLIALAGCGKKTSVDYNRPLDPWVFRSVLDQHSRMITLALNPEMYAAYSGETGQLYKVWKGGVHLEGVAYTNVKTVQPETWGEAYLEYSLTDTLWRIVEGENILIPELNYSGYTYVDGQVQIEFSGKAGNQVFTVKETPEYFSSSPDKAGFRREFEVTGLGSGVKLRLEDEFVITGNGHFVFEKNWPQLSDQQPVAREIVGHNGEYWLDRSGCNTCHQKDAKMIGPAYKQIAGRYERNDENMNQLIAKVKNGGAGNWGDVPMNPHSHLEEQDIRTMLDYVLRLTPDKNTEDKPRSKKKLKEAQPVSPGFGAPLEGVHPGMNLSTIRPENFKPRVGGMAFLPDGRLLVTTWDTVGGVYILDGVTTGDASQVSVKRFAEGLSEPLGIEVVDGEIYVLQKQELTHLIDHNGDDQADEYRSVCHSFGVTADFHEFSYGLVWHEGYFYANLGLAMRLMSFERQHPDRGKTIKIAPDGTWKEVVSGLRQCNGIGKTPDGDIFLTENQGQWVPGCKLIHLREGDFHGCQFGFGDFYADRQMTQPTAWLPQDEIGNSPGEPVYVEKGPYAGQILIADVSNGGIRRVFLEKINGEYRGRVFRFSQGFEAGLNRMRWGPDGALYVGGVGMVGGWSWKENQYGLQRLEWNGKPAFEMLAIRHLDDGFEIEFTEPLVSGTGRLAKDYTIQQWYYQPTSAYGGPKLDHQTLPVSGVEVSPDGKKVKLLVEGVKPGHVVYFLLNEGLKSESGYPLWNGEAWCTI